MVGYMFTGLAHVKYIVDNMACKLSIKMLKSRFYLCLPGTNVS